MARDWDLSDGAESEAPEQADTATTSALAALIALLQTVNLHRAPSGVDRLLHEQVSTLAEVTLQLSARLDRAEAEATKHKKKIAFLCSVIQYNVERSRIGFDAAECKVLEEKIMKEWKKGRNSS